MKINGKIICMDDDDTLNKKIVENIIKKEYKITKTILDDLWDGEN